MKKRWLCGILICILLLLTACQAPVPPAADGGDDILGDDEAEAPQDPQTNNEPYVRQYAYPEGVEYTAFFTTKVAEGGMYRKGTQVYRGAWNFVSEVPDGMSWTMETDTALAIAKAYAEDAYMHYFEKPENTLTFEFTNPRLILSSDGRLAMMFDFEVDMKTMGDGYYSNPCDGGQILIFDTAGVTAPAS